MIKLREEGMLETELGQKLGFLFQTVSQAVKAKEKFLNEMPSATPGNA